MLVGMDTTGPCNSRQCRGHWRIRGLSVGWKDRASASRDLGAIIDLLRAAREDYDAVVELTRRLVRVPSRGGIDPYGPVLECMSAWLGEHGLACRRVAGPGGTPVALTCELPGGRPGPRFVLDACLDTAPFGDEAAWTHPPASGTGPRCTGLHRFQAAAVFCPSFYPNRQHS